MVSHTFCSLNQIANRFFILIAALNAFSISIFYNYALKCYGLSLLLSALKFQSKLNLRHLNRLLR